MKPIVAVPDGPQCDDCRRLGVLCRHPLLRAVDGGAA